MKYNNYINLLYYLLLITIIMSIICYFVNMENFAGTLPKKKKRIL